MVNGTMVSDSRRVEGVGSASTEFQGHWPRHSGRRTPGSQAPTWQQGNDTVLSKGSNIQASSVMCISLSTIFPKNFQSTSHRYGLNVAEPMHAGHRAMCVPYPGYLQLRSRSLPTYLVYLRVYEGVFSLPTNPRRRATTTATATTKTTINSLWR